MNKIIAHIVVHVIGFLIVFFITPAFYKMSMRIGDGFLTMLKGIKEMFINTAKEWKKIIKGEI